MSDRLPRTEYDINYLQIVIFIIIFISLIFLSFFAGYYAGKKSVNNKKEILSARKQTPKKIRIKGKTAIKKNEKETSKRKSNNILNGEKQPKEKITGKYVKNKETIVNPVEKTKTKQVNRRKNKKRSYRRGYYIQVAAFKDLNSAKRRALKFRKKFKVIIYYPQPTDKAKWYRLWVGPYENTAGVNRALKRLKKEFKIKGFIRKLE